MSLAGKRYHLANGEVAYVHRPPGGAFVVQGDREELVAAVTNLVDNAVKYSGDRVRVAVEVARVGARRVAISVRDQGIGITGHELKRVFRRFYRLPAALRSRVRGTGLGLSIVRAVARPARRPRVRREPRRRPGEHLHPRAAPEGVMSRVLIVEDEEHLAAGLKLNLEEEGFTAEVEEDGAAALQRLLGAGAGGFDVVLLDVMLPGLDGFEVVRRLRAARQFVPVMLLTARSDNDDVLRGFEAGADDYLPKPFDLSILLARLAGLLRRRRWLRGDARGRGRPEELDEYPPRRRDGRFSQSGAAPRPVGAAADRDGGDAAPLPGEPRRRDRVAQGAARGSLGACATTPTRGPWTISSPACGRYIEAQPARPRHLLTVRGVGYRFVDNPDGDNPEPAPQNGS